MRDDEKRKRWERATAWPGIVGSILFLVAYTWTVLSDDQPTALYVALLLVLGLVWAFFLVDYVVRFVLAEDRPRFVRHNIVDLLSVLLPLARPFRLLGDLSRIPILRGNTPAHLRRRVLTIAAIFIVMFIYIIALAEYQVEHTVKGANILTFGDALWWACVTMATVGYGDYYPVTVGGRLLAIVLMIGGIAIVGTASATVVSYLNERTQHLRHHSPSDTGRELRLPQDDDPDVPEDRG